MTKKKKEILVRKRLITLAVGVVVAGTLVLTNTAQGETLSRQSPPSGADVGSQTTADATSGSYSQCPLGYFCVWWDYYGNDPWWYKWYANDRDWRDNYYYNSNGFSVFHHDGSWYNHGTACAGCDHVRVYSSPGYSGTRTICLARGQAVGYYPSATDKGASHSWYGSC